MAQGYELKEKQIVRTGREKKVRLTEKEISDTRNAHDPEALATLIGKKLGVKIKARKVGVFGIGASEKASKGPKPREEGFVVEKGWWSVQDEDGTWYTFDNDH